MLGVSKVAAYKGFMKVLQRNSDRDIKSFHPMELQDLELEQADIWKTLDQPGYEENAKVRLRCHDRLNRVHIRRARLLGLNAPQKLDIRWMYRMGSDQNPLSAWRRSKTAGDDGDTDAIHTSVAFLGDKNDQDAGTRM
jgi:hypothetical protein